MADKNLAAFEKYWHENRNFLISLGVSKDAAALIWANAISSLLEPLSNQISAMMATLQPPPPPSK